MAVFFCSSQIQYFCWRMEFKVINQEVIGFNKNVSLFIKREDLLHPYISGNKFRKLKYKNSSGVIFLKSFMFSPSVL